MSEPLHTATNVLQEEAQAGREEGDSPVGEQAGAQVEVLTVDEALLAGSPTARERDGATDVPASSGDKSRRPSGAKALQVVHTPGRGRVANQ